MQTFLPYPAFDLSAQVLDRQRLGKQRVETLQLLKAIVHGSGWSNHACAKMWKNDVDVLVVYGVVMCDEWLKRGYKDTCRDKILAYSLGKLPTNMGVPEWLGRPDLHASHRSNLLRKDSAWYGRFGWTESNDLPYVWPIVK